DRPRRERDRRDRRAARRHGRRAGAGPPRRRGPPAGLPRPSGRRPHLPADRGRAAHEVRGAGGRADRRRAHVRASAFYDRETGWLFIRNTTLEGFTAAFLHEATHYLQNIYRPGMTQFMREFEAYSVQRGYLQRLVADGANPDVAFPNYKWLVDADNERIVQHIWDRYQVRPPPGADLEATVMEALGNVGRIEVP